MPVGFTPESRSSLPGFPTSILRDCNCSAALATTPKLAAWNQSVAAVWEED
jgi:hypothetical protein